MLRTRFESQSKFQEAKVLAVVREQRAVFVHAHNRHRFYEMPTSHFQRQVILLFNLNDLKKKPENGPKRTELNERFSRHEFSKAHRILMKIESRGATLGLLNFCNFRFYNSTATTISSTTCNKPIHCCKYWISCWRCDLPSNT